MNDRAWKDQSTNTAWFVREIILDCNKGSYFIHLLQNMIEASIMEQWLTQRSDEALKKLINHEPLTFEDNVVIALVGQHEEIRRLEKKMDDNFAIQNKKADDNFLSLDKKADDNFAIQNKKTDDNFLILDKKIDKVHTDLRDEITDVKISLRDLRVEMNEYRRTNEDLRKTMLEQTRWTVALVTLILALAKIVDFLK